MAVIYEAKILLKTGSGYPGVVLDYGEAGYDGSSNKFWIGNGIGSNPTGITMDASFNILYGIVNNLEASAGNFTSFPYVDGSLAKRDASINNLYLIKLEASALYPYATNASVGLSLKPFATNASIATAGFATNASVGLAIGLAIAPFATNSSVGIALYPYATNSSIGFANFTNHAYVDGSLAQRDVSISWLNTNKIEGTGVYNQVAFWDATKSVAGNINFIFDPVFLHLALGQSSIDPDSTLIINSGVTSHSSVARFYGIYDSFIQAEVRNQSSGPSASADMVASNDIGTDQANYIDLGINSTTYGAPDSLPGDGYLILNTDASVVAGNLLILNSTYGKDIILATGEGINAYVNERLRITFDGSILIGQPASKQYKLEINGDVNVPAGSTYRVNGIPFGIGTFASFSYVDGSLSALNSSVNAAFVTTNASFGRYATNASVGIALYPYATNASVGIALYPYATNASVGLAIQNFATNASVNAALFTTNASFGAYATNASVGLALGPYATNSSVNAALLTTNASFGAYATNASVGLALGPYATNASVGIALQPYATNSSVNATFVTTNASFGAYATNASVGLALGPYATNSSVNAAFVTTNASFGRYATNASVGLAIAPFATNSSVGLALGPYATNSSVNAALLTTNASFGVYATNASVGLAIAPFATNASVGLAIAPFATNASVGLALGAYTTNASANAAFVTTNASFGRYATNASVGLAIAPFATNASVGLAIAPFATNASVNAALFTTNASFAPYATNASVGLTLGKYIPNASLGTDFYWQTGLLEVSLGSILSTGKNLTLDASGNIAVVNSPNFSGDVSIQGNLFANQKIELGDVTVSNSSIGDLWYQSPRLYFRDGSTNRDILQGSLKGTVYPPSPSEGDLYHRIDEGLLFVYDSSRGKYLSVFRVTFGAGRASAVAGTDTYMRVGDATQSSTAGFRMFRNGTITAVSVYNNNTLTATRNIEVRVNNSAVNKVTLNIPNGQAGSQLRNGNQDFSAGDLIQVVALAGAVGSALANVIVTIEMAWRV